MKKFKWLAVAIALVVMVTMVAGCGQKDDQGGAQGGTDVEEGAILVGMNLELSGNVANYGKAVDNAMMMVFDEYNASGDGPKIQTIKYDNKSDSGESLNIATKLIAQDKVAVVIGPVTSTNALATVPVAEEYKVPTLTPTGTNADITVKDGKVNEYMFRSCFIDPFQGVVAARFAADNLGAKNVAVFVETNTDYSKGLKDAFAAAFEGFGGNIIAVEGYVTEDQDYRATLTKLKGANPDLIYVPTYYEQAGKIIQQAREIGYEGPLLGTDGWDSPVLLEIAGAESLQNCFFTNHYSAEDNDPLVVNFVTAYREKFGSTPDALAALGYDGAQILVNAIKKAGSADPQAIRDALAATENFVGVTGTISMDEFHNPVKGAVILSFTPEGEQTFVARVNP